MTTPISIIVQLAGNGVCAMPTTASKSQIIRVEFFGRLQPGIARYFQGLALSILK
jgi:hypothetical protein